jgi:hypothetical protein
MTTEQRLERLERENRWMRRMGAVAVAVAAAVFLMGQQYGRTLKADTLRVGGPLKHVRIDGDGITIRDADGTARIVLGIDKKNTAGLSLSDGDGVQRAILVASANGFTNMDLKDRNGRVGLGSIDGKYVMLVLRDKSDRVVWKAPHD